MTDNCSTEKSINKRIQNINNSVIPSGISLDYKVSYLTYLLSLKTLDNTQINNCLSKIKSLDELFEKNTMRSNLITLIFRRFQILKDNLPENILKFLNIEIIKKYLEYCKEYNAINPKVNTSLLTKYTNNGQGSALLNSAMFEYFYTNLPLYTQYKTNILAIIKGFKGFKETIKEPLTVFHGTNTILHGSGKTFTTYGFLSTTTDMNIANAYGKHVYILKIENCPYLYLNDQSNKQILLPVGITIIIDNTISATNNCIFFGKIDVSQIQDRLTIIKTIIVKSPEQSITIDNTDFAKFINKNECISELPKRSCKRTPYTIKKGASSITYYKNQNSISVLKFVSSSDPDFIIRRLINEKLASSIYNKLGLKAFDHTIYNLEGNYCIGSPMQNIQYNIDKELATQYLKGFIWDCILANWDVGNTGNVGVINRKIIRTDVGGSLAYRARGEFKIEFFNNSQPTEYIFLLQQPLLQKCMTMLGITKETIYTSLEIKEFLVKDKTELINTLNIDWVPEPYKVFAQSILAQVNRRYDYYKSIINRILPQQGGKIKYNNRIYNVRTSNKDKYIIVKKEKINLNIIRGKYRYYKGGDSINNAINKVKNAEEALNTENKNTELKLQQAIDECIQRTGDVIIEQLPYNEEEYKNFTEYLSKKAPLTQPV